MVGFLYLSYLVIDSFTLIEKKNLQNKKTWNFLRTVLFNYKTFVCIYLLSILYALNHIYLAENHFLIQLLIFIIISIYLLISASLDEDRTSPIGTSAANIISEKNNESLSSKQRHQIKHRELFLSRQVETLPATHIRGKCSVTLLNETESLNSYLNKDVSRKFHSIVASTNNTLHKYLKCFNIEIYKIIIDVFFFFAYYFRIHFFIVWFLIQIKKHCLRTKVRYV